VIASSRIRIGHEGIGVEERAQLWIIVSGVEVVQPGVIDLLPGELMIRGQGGKAAAETTLGIGNLTRI
jgi:hypothetical protein